MKKAALLLILFCSMATTEEGWHIETVDDDCEYAWANTLALDSSGDTHIVYNKYNGEQYIYAYWNGIEWVKEVIDTGGFDCTLAIDEQDNLHLAYGPILRYALWDGVEWQTEYVDGRRFDCYTSITVDSSSNPHITYFPWPEYCDLTYVTKVDEDWVSTTVDDGLVEAANAIVLDSNDRPRILYSKEYDYFTTDLIYTWWDGVDWNFSKVDDYYEIDEDMASLALDSYDNPHVIYVNPSWYKLRYATYTDDVWEISIIAEELSDASRVSIQIDAYDKPHIAFFRHDSLRYAFFENAEWHTHDVDWSDFRYGWNDLVLDEDDYPHISYNDYRNGLIKYAWYGEDLGVSVGNLFARADDEGILLNWLYDGPTPVSLELLRAAGAESWIGAASYPLPADANMHLDREVMPGVEYHYWLEVIEDDGSVHRFGPTEPVTIPAGTDNITLAEPYPCPAAGRVTIEYAVPEATHVELVVYDLAGRRVATLVDGEQTAGRHEVSWDCTEIPPGVYLYRLETGAGSLTQRLVVSR